jgi:CRP-like cAMP-binding protein
MRLSDPKVLESSLLYKGLTPIEIDLVQRAAKVINVKEKEFFFFQGDTADRLYILASGKVKLTQVTPDGQQIIFTLAGIGMLFGAIAMVEGAEYPVSAEAMQDSRAWSWSHVQIMEFVKQMPALALNAVKLMAQQVQEFQARYRELATERVERRLARALLRMAAQAGKKTPQGVLIDMRLTRQDLAEMTGATLFTVSRIISQWEAHGLVIGGRERVTIVFPHGLVQIAEDLPGRSEDRSLEHD